MKKIVVVLLVLITQQVFSQGWNWKSQIQGGSYLKVINIVTHSDGRSFLLFEFAGTITVGAATASSDAGTNDIAVAAFDDMGALLWLQTIGSNDADIAAGIAIDESNNCLYVNGDFKNTCNFGGAASLTSDGLFDAFLAKYSLSGTLLNARRIAWGATSQRATSLCVDNSGNVVVTGLFLDAASLDGGYAFTGNGITSNYIAKYNASGTIQWAKKTLGKYTVSWFRDIKSFSGGYIIAGQFRDTLFLDVQTIVSAAANLDMFLYAIDNNGNGSWVRTIKGGLGDDQFNRLSVAGDIYLSGVTKSDTLTIQTGSSGFQTAGIGNSGNFDMVLFSYSTSGNYNWHKKYGSVSDDRSLAVDASGTKMATVGYYSGAISIETETPSFNAGTDGFHAIYSSAGALEELTSFNGSGSDYLRAVSFLSDGGQMVAGEFNSPVLYYSGDSIVNAAAGSYSGFVAKYGCFNVLAMTSTSVSCPGGSNGTATASPAGGKLPYTYLWSNGQTGSTATGLTIGTYSITVTDANNCTKAASVTVTQVPTVSLAVASFSNNTCDGGNNGSITVNASNGSTPYGYNWNTVPAQTSSIATGLSAGTYTCTVTDACSSTATVSQNILNTASHTVTLTVTNITCNGLTNGAVESSVSGTGSPFTYAWSNLATTQNIANLAAGTYTVTVTNACGASVVASATLTEPTAIVVDYQVWCTKKNQSTGWAQANPTGGSPGYTYVWNTYQTTQRINNLGKGTYSVTVTDSRGCTKVRNKIRIKECNPSWPPDDTTAAKVSDGSEVVLVFPNPADHYVNISGKQETQIIHIDIYDVTGRIVLTIEEGKIQENKALVDISGWKKGLYMIVVNTGNTIQSKQLLIE